MTEPRNASQELVFTPADDLRDPELLKETISTFLDVAAMVAISVGVGWGLVTVLGVWGIALGGVVLGVLNLVAGIARQPVPAPEPEPEPVAVRVPLPGPEDAGPLHVSEG
jgi:hypothetical protein